MTASRIVIAAFAGLGWLSVFAQVSPPGTSDQQNQTTAQPNPGAPANDANSPAGNSPAGNNPAAKDGKGTTKDDKTMTSIPLPTGPEIVEDPNATPEQKASAEYAGPAVLSRGISASEPMNPQNLKFTPSLGLEYTYNSGLTGVNIQQNGTLANTSAQGVSLNYSLVGEKVYQKDVFSLTFNGFAYHYFNASTYDGSSNALAMTWRHQMSKHLSFGVQVSATEFNQNNLILSGADYINTGAGTTLVTTTPATAAFDGRVVSFYTQGSLTYRVNARLSFNLSGGGFLTRLASTSLYGDTGYQASGDVAYRLTRQTTVGAYYDYTHFDYVGLFGETNVNTVGVTYSIAFSPRTELMTRIGGSRAEISTLTALPLNPLLSLLFGTTAVPEAVHQISYAPDLNAQLRHKERALTYSLAYARGITPGNGLILTSSRQTMSGGIDGKFLRTWSFNLTSGYDALNSIGPGNNERYTSVFGAANVYRRLIKSVDWHARFDYHHYLFDNTGFLQNVYILSTGFVWNPGNVFERVW